MGKKKGGGATRTDEVRQYLEEHPDAKPKEVVQVMAERGIKVTPNFVSQIKTRMRNDDHKTTKKTTKKAAKKKAAGTAVATMPAEAAAPVRDKLSAEDLFEAKKLADELGGIEQARRALDMLERLR